MKKLIGIGLFAAALFCAPAAHAEHPTPRHPPVINPARLTMPSNVDDGGYDDYTNVSDGDGTLGAFDRDYDFGARMQVQNMAPFSYGPAWPGHDARLSYSPGKHEKP